MRALAEFGVAAIRRSRTVWPPSYTTQVVALTGDRGSWVNRSLIRGAATAYTASSAFPANSRRPTGSRTGLTFTDTIRSPTDSPNRCGS